MSEQQYNPAQLISHSATTSVGSGTTLPIHPIYGAVGGVALGIVILVAVLHRMGRGAQKDLRQREAALQKQREVTDLKKTLRV